MLEVTYSNLDTGAEVKVLCGKPSNKEEWVEFHTNCRVYATHKRRLGWKRYKYTYKDYMEESAESEIDCPLF